MMKSKVILSEILSAQSQLPDVDHSTMHQELYDFTGGCCHVTDHLG